MSLVKYMDAAVDLGEPVATEIFRPHWEKTAGMNIYMPEKIAKFMDQAEPVKGQRLLLVHGLGGDPWGANRNGDIFPEMWKGAKNLIEDDPSKNYGYLTFEKNAHTFRDHNNSDPKYSIGGKVVCAAWNDKMHRVELIIPVSERKAPDICDAIDNYEKVAVSMGAKVPYDVCTVCQNKARHRGEYCKHASMMMGHIMGDGVKVAVHNPKPNFFDISILGHRGQGRPADPSAFSLAKVAMVNGHTFERPDVRGYTRKDLRKNAFPEGKRSDHMKEMPGYAEDAEQAAGAEADGGHVHRGDPNQTADGEHAHSEENPEGCHTHDEGQMADEEGGEGMMSIDHLFEIIKQMLPHDLLNQMPMDGQMVMRISKEGADDSLPTLMAAGIVLTPEEFNKIGWDSMPRQIDFHRFSPSLFSTLKVAMPNRSMWLSHFGDRIFRLSKQANLREKEQLPEHGLGYYAQYVGLVKQATLESRGRDRLLKLVERNPSIAYQVFRGEFAPEITTKVANKVKGLTAGNLMASFLGPLILSAYFRGKQMDPMGSGTGPVQGMVAEHPMATGAATALLWHKLKGGKVPLIS